ncbi:hypothetical protein AR540_22585 [Pseudomonas sp. EpS/L25]|nr:hypothetical protein AR540_22585 [Pseudomonas sp. EpS/L25]
MLTTLITAASLSAGLVFGWNRLERRRDQDASQALILRLQVGLDLLQGVQQHRGLGGQDSREAQERRAALQRRLKPLWHQWGDADQYRRWQEVCQTPTDLEAHCQLIERLLQRWRLLELHLRSLHPTRPSLVERCQAIENLGLIRGLGVRAARHPRCPLELQIRLKYLCEQLHSGQVEPALAQALERLRQELLDTPQVSLGPEACFALFTPLIDARLEALRPLVQLDMTKVSTSAAACG